MALSRLGDYIESVDVRNTDSLFGVFQLRGISINKVLTPTKANTDNLDLSNYKVVKNSWFTYCVVTSRNGNKISLAYNDEEDCIVSSINPVFKIKNEKRLLPRYLMMFFNRSEFDRYARFNSWGSARETFSWDDFCDIVLEIPSIEIQKKYVAIYEGLLANLHSYERGLKDIKIALDSSLDKCKNSKHLKLSEVISCDNTKNGSLDVPFCSLRGINEQCEFCSTRDSIKENQIGNYLIVKRGRFAVNFMCLGNFGKFYLAYNDLDIDVIVSPACNGFYLVGKKIDPYYLLAFLRRDEFQRHCVFCGTGNTRGGINFDDFLSLDIPVPSDEMQTVVANLYKIFDSRRQCVDDLTLLIQSMCPILIRGSIKESRGGSL